MTQTVSSINDITYIRHKDHPSQNVSLHDKKSLKERLNSEYSTLIQHTAFKTLFENTPRTASNQIHIQLSIKRKHLATENKYIYQITLIDKDRAPTIIQAEHVDTTLARIFQKTVAASQAPKPSVLSNRLSEKRPPVLTFATPKTSSIPLKTPLSATSTAPSVEAPQTPTPKTPLSASSVEAQSKKEKPKKKSVWQWMKNKWDNLFTKPERLEDPKKKFNFDPQDMSPAVQEEHDALFEETPESPVSPPSPQGLSLKLSPL